MVEGVLVKQVRFVEEKDGWTWSWPALSREWRQRERRRQQYRR